MPATVTLRRDIDSEDLLLIVLISSQHLTGVIALMSTEYGTKTIAYKRIEVPWTELEEREQRTARGMLSRRLDREFDAALLEPKLYKRLDRGSELVRFATALASLPADQARLLRAEVAAPLLARARSKNTPRKIRSAVQDAVDPH